MDSLETRDGGAHFSPGRGLCTSWMDDNMSDDSVCVCVAVLQYSDLTCHNIGGSLVRECVAARPVSRLEGERGGMEEDRESA